jgi:hypothetical protein
VRQNGNEKLYRNATHKRYEYIINCNGMLDKALEFAITKCDLLTQNRIVFGGLCCNKKYLRDE